jgi:peroxiredoxin
VLPLIGAPIRVPEMLGVGDRIPEATVFAGPREPVKLAEIAAGEPFLLLFYLFDWTST